MAGTGGTGRGVLWRTAVGFASLFLPLAATPATGCTVERERTPHPASGSRIHEDGISDPESPGFHGALLRETGYDFAVCARCHGDDFDGGTSGAACTDCHEQGPRACDTCHMLLLESGAHAAHLPGGELVFSARTCGGCHRVPRAWDEAGHVFLDDGALDPPPVELALSGLAVHRPDGAPSEARWSSETRSCEGVYCHGGAFDDADATNTAPEWDLVGEGEAACGACHGIPPSNHASGACRTCHGDLVADDGSLADPSRHVDGVVDLGRTDDPDACDACHGSTDSPAPPSDLLGRTSLGLVSVGAHTVHVRGAHRLSSPIACEECHVVPAARDDAGHIDSALPAEVVFGELASAHGTSPAWLPGATRCANVYCHGNGAVFAGDAAPGRVTAPGWTALGTGAGACGACHGVPPLDGTHDPAATLADCATCHTSLDEFGHFLFTGERSQHIDGTVDLR
jgi:predicted CxxxxCH...CXXCH cytochrome family protein